MVPADDLSITGNIGILRGLKRTQVSFDTAGQPVLSDGAFRTKEGSLSAFRADEASEADVFKQYPQALWVARLTVQDIRDVRCIIQNETPPKGHVGIYRKDNPGQRIGSGPVGQMAKKARLSSVLNPNPQP
jgi:hypothetical protein